MDCKIYKIVYYTRNFTVILRFLYGGYTSLEKLQYFQCLIFEVFSVNIILCKTIDYSQVKLSVNFLSHYIHSTIQGWVTSLF